MTLTDITATLKTYDLRRVASGAPAGDLFLGHNLPVSTHPEFLFCRAQGDDLSGSFDTRNRHLVVIVLEGVLSIAFGEITLELTAGKSASIAPDTCFDWQGQGSTMWLVNLYEDSASVKGQHAVSVQVIAENTLQRLSASPSEKLLIGTAPICSKAVVSEAADGKWSVGTWTATPYHRLPVTSDYYEMMQLFEGSVTIFNASGECLTFKTGDLLLIAKGAKIGWKSTEKVRKLWSIYTPDKI